MDDGALGLAMLALGIGLGLLLGIATYAAELRRMARFLAGRGESSNARLTVNAPAPGLTELACAVNDELDRAADARIDAQRSAQEFQRGLSALSHDIRTPLAGARGYLQLAGDEGDGASRARRLDAAIERIDATTALLDQLFAYTKASDPDLTLDSEPVAVEPAMESVLLAHLPDFERRGWEPSVSFADPGLVVSADRGAFERVVENLVANAVGHGAGTLSIVQEGRAVSFSNRVDDPTSIDVDRLFERFYRADTARGAGGTGLGLATASQLARAMGMGLRARLDGDVLTVVLELP